MSLVATEFEGTRPRLNAVSAAGRADLSGLDGLLLGTGFVDDLAGEMPGNLLVAQEVHRELALATGDRPQIRGVRQHLRHRDLGLDLGHPGAHGLHSERPAAAGVEVADHVSNRVLGRVDRDEHDRLEQDRTGLLHGLLHGQRAGDFERHLRRVDGVVGAVVEADPDVLDRIAGHDSLVHRLDDTLLDRRDEAVRDHAALDRVHELEARGVGGIV